MYQNLKCIGFELPKNYRVKVRYGWTELGRFIRDVDYLVKKKHFFAPQTILKKSTVSEIWRCLKVSDHCGQKLSCKVTPLRSASLSIKWYSIFDPGFISLESIVKRYQLVKITFRARLHRPVGKPYANAELSKNICSILFSQSEVCVQLLRNNLCI